MSDLELLNRAIRVQENTHSPYSKFPVGAAILLLDGNVVVGTNVENASYGATICAERSAVCSAVSQGYKKEDFVKIAISSNLETITPPCCVCRQVLTELFSLDSDIIMGNSNGLFIVEKLSTLAPYSFHEEDLKKRRNYEN